MKKIFLSLAVVFAVNSAQAGHLFTQASTNTPIFLAAGTGVDIPQNATEGSSTSARGFRLYLSGWSAGDALRLIIGSYDQTFSFDSPLAGTSQGSTYLRNFTLASLTGIGSTGFTSPGNWRLESTAGDGFTFTGYRIYTDANGVLDGTNAGLLNQQAVTSNVPPASNVPVPSVIALMLSGLLGFSLSRRKA